MTNFKTRLAFLGKIFLALLSLATLLLIAGRHLFSIISPLDLLLYAGFGTLLLLAVVALAAMVAARWDQRAMPDGRG
ncbi:hypothetical protein [Variovorax sp. GT1P44]|uniref:hypothetical protein n=1 Tax=Variovorax sp. GT1P44 TaxID=3443742 RepID=UPI003F47AF56